MMFRYIFILFAVFITCLPASSQDNACDPEYFKSLKARAWLEAQREITQNQNLIFKPDSVFEYTCFDLYMNELAHHAKDMFSETLRWGRIPNVHTGPGEPTSMDTTLEALTGVPLRTYIDQNFEQTGVPGNTYDLLGGRASQKTDSSGNVVQDAIDHDFQQIDGTDAAGRNQYNCEIMNLVWMRAKCMDFIDSQEHDGFFTFEEYRDYAATGQDHRFLPRMCAAVTRWEEEINIAYTDNTGNERAPGTPWVEPEITLFGSLLGTCNNTVRIETGLDVMVRGNARPEAVCISPGCYHNVATQQCTR